MSHRIIIIVTALLIAFSTIAELLFPSKMLAFVGIASNPQTDFLLRTTAVALIAILPSLWTARNDAKSPASRSALLGIAVYMFLSSAVDFQAFTQGIVNSMSVPSVAFRVLLGITILWLIVRGASKEETRGRVVILEQLNRLAAGKPRFDFMPEGNLAFAILPAQINFPSVSQGREIEQTGVDILDQHTRILNKMDKHIELLEVLNQVTQSTVATIPCGFFNRGPGFGLLCKDLLANRLNFIHQRADGY